jgi:hypothetical protein
MHIARTDSLAGKSDAHIRVYDCPACRHEMRLKPLPVAAGFHNRGHSTVSGLFQFPGSPYSRHANREGSYSHPVRHHSFGSIISDVRGAKDSVPMAQARTRKEKRSDWWLTVEQIGRELRKIYPPVDVPPGLHALFTESHRRASAARNDQGDDKEAQR